MQGRRQFFYDWRRIQDLVRCIEFHVYAAPNDLRDLTFLHLLIHKGTETCGVEPRVKLLQQCGCRPFWDAGNNRLWRISSMLLP